MSTRPMNAEQLLADVAKHALTIKLDNGVYRHLSFRQPPPYSWNQWFDIITWPGNLVIRGDMGTWAFSRVEDMFRFFRSVSTGELKINASYWHEKIDAESRFGGPAKKFDPDTFKTSVLCSLEGYGLLETEKASVLLALEEEVFSEEHEYPAMTALRGFNHNGFQFSDAWEISGHGYSYHFLWCLYAIVWAIQQYDAATLAQANQEESANV